MIAQKSIEFDRETRDFAAIVDGEVIGYYPTHLDAAAAADDLINRRQRTVADVPVAYIEEEAQRRTDALTAESHSETPDDAAHAKRRLNALNKAVLHALDDITVRRTLGDYLINSGTRGGVVHRVSARYGCSCEAGQKNQPCWHAELADILTAYGDEQADADAPRHWYEEVEETARERAYREIDECFDAQEPVTAFPAWATRPRPALFKDEA